MEESNIFHNKFNKLCFVTNKIQVAIFLKNKGENKGRIMGISLV